MYDLSDTIVAVSSPTSGQRVIVRLTGSDTLNKCQQIFSPRIPNNKPGLISGTITVAGGLTIDARLYLFLAPHSYTGHTLVEIHTDANPSVTEAVIAKLLAIGVRAAQPGEFTARAYLNGKIDLAQAEAVNEIITSSNEFQLAAAEKLLAGRLAQTTAKVCAQMMDCISLIEAGIDFSQEDIEFITSSEAAGRLTGINEELEHLLVDSISCESLLDLPSVGIAGAPNVGKSSLLNKLLGKERSIVSQHPRTTRDVLTSLLTLAHTQCVLFDCAGLLPEPEDVLDELSHQAAIEAIHNASIIVFCVDISKPATTDYSEDVTVRKLIEPKALIPIATKSDLLAEDELSKRIADLDEIFGCQFFPTSAKDGSGLQMLRTAIDKKLIAATPATALAAEINPVVSQVSQSHIALTARHKQAVTEAIENVTEARNEIKAGNDEVAAMMLRTAHQALSNIEQQNIDEQILENIFSRFCIGK